MILARVSDIVNETDTVKSFRLVRSDGAPLGPYPAGAHIDVTGPTGITRQYSLCGPPHETDSFLVAVKRETPSRGGSAAMHDDVRVGSELRISEPRNLFGIAPHAADHVLVGAGIGVTPLLAMAHQLHRERRNFRLHYFASARGQAAFTDLLELSGFAARVRFHFGVPRPGQQEALDAILSYLGPGTHVYTCGPKEFMRRVTVTAARSLPEDRVHIEHFQPPDPVGETGSEFELELDTGEVFTVPVDRSIVDVLAENGFDVDTSCREGVCGTCVLPVLEGEPDHRDNCLTRKEKAANDQIATCVSRARGRRLVIEF
ncbi:PDR/VanB family oxidoreductase [Streptomyces sp. NBC_01373]|uniref:PDR/VanB family oxidoreductase n=1 Tax=Streptomyces sp. NBC_01373 TaxID=2903843 RepID=UPI00225086EC|nr:PDR/VanB family oxidoreductase [Streptomyces sp. NBC_01373]MCX4703175.1 PDR/VanB family oxidoreductase [Streptomyces sp. NBC_01373]